MHITGIGIKKFILVTLKQGPWVTAMTGGSSIIQEKNVTTKDGLGEVFASNVMGHFALVENLKDALSPSHDNCSCCYCNTFVAWMSSGTALSVKSINMDDIQGLLTPHPYEQSKRLCEIVALKKAPQLLNEHKIHTFILSPGVCISNIAKKNIFSKIGIFLAIILVRILPPSLYFFHIAFKILTTFSFISNAAQDYRVLRI